MAKCMVYTVYDLIEFLKNKGAIRCTTLSERKRIIEAITELGAFDMAHAIEYLANNGESTEYMHPALCSENTIAFFNDDGLSVRDYVEYKEAMNAIYSEGIEDCCMTENDFEAKVAEMLSIKL